MDGRRGKVVCHLRKGGDIKQEIKQERGCIHGKKQRASMWGRKIIIAFDTKTARANIGSEPV